MRKISKAVTLLLATTAFTAFLTPAAEAQSNARLTVCVWGANGRDVDVEINRFGPGGFRDDEADPCVTFYGLRRGTYNIEIDPPWGYRTWDDDRIVRLSSGESERVSFRVNRNWDWHDDHDDDWDNEWDNDRPRRLCPPGERPVFDNNPNTPLCQDI